MGISSDNLSTDDVPRLIRELYEIVNQFEAIFEGRHFTPDGHLVGSIGEALASHYYGVKLTKASTAGYDGLCRGKRVEVKATQGDTVALSAFSSCPEHLMAFRLCRSGSFEECFNGPAILVWDLVKDRKPPKNGQHRVGLNTLRNLMKNKVRHEDMLEPVIDLPPDTKRNMPGASTTIASGTQDGSAQGIRRNHESP